MDRYLSTHYGEYVPMYNYGGSLINPNSEQFGMCGDDLVQILFAAACVHVLIDGRIRQQPEAYFVSGRHHDRASLGSTTHKVRALNRRAR